MSTTRSFEDAIRASFKQFANILYDEIVDQIDTIIASKNEIIKELEARQSTDNESYNKVSMITRQDKEIKLLKERNAVLERELIAARSNKNIVPIIDKDVQEILETPVIAEKAEKIEKAKKPRAIKPKKETIETTDEKAKIRGRKKKGTESTPIIPVEETEIPDITVKETEIPNITVKETEIPVKETEIPVEETEIPVEETEIPVKSVVNSKKCSIEPDIDRPNINDLDIIEHEGFDYYLNPTSNKIYEMTPTGDLGTCIGEKLENDINFY
jgi:hypothetical protein